MNNEYKEEFNVLLDNWWVSKVKSSDAFYKIKSKITNLREIANKMGCDIICNNKLIKLEKNPLWLDNVYGIPEFDRKLDYVLFLVLIIYLEGKGLDEQFILSNFTDYVSNCLANIDGVNKPDWTNFKDRKSMVDVLKYATSIGIIRLRDGNDANFAENANTEALYENTTLSHYVVRNFKFDVFSCNSARDFIDKELETLDSRDYKRIVTYRSLFLYPHVYFPDLNTESLIYLKNMRNNVANDVETYVGGELIFVKNMAFVSMIDKQNNVFPNMNQSITDIIILISHYLREYIVDNNLNSNSTIKMDDFKIIVEKVYKENSKYFSKKYRDLTKENFFKTMINQMVSYKMLKVMDSEILVYPITTMYDGIYDNDTDNIEENKNYEILSFNWEE